MTDIKNLERITSDSEETLRLARRKRVHRKIEADPQLERKIMKVRGNISSIKLQVRRLAR